MLDMVQHNSATTAKTAILYLIVPVKDEINMMAINIPPDVLIM